MESSAFPSAQEIIDMTLNAKLPVIPNIPPVLVVPQNLDLPPAPPEYPDPEVNAGDNLKIIPFPSPPKDVLEDTGLAKGLQDYAIAKGAEDIFALKSRESHKSAIQKAVEEQKEEKKEEEKLSKVLEELGKLLKSLQKPPAPPSSAAPPSSRAPPSSGAPPSAGGPPSSGAPPSGRAPPSGAPPSGAPPSGAPPSRGPPVSKPAGGPSSSSGSSSSSSSSSGSKPAPAPKPVASGAISRYKIDVNRLNAVEPGKGVPPGALPGYSLAELKAFVDKVKADGFPIKVTGTKVQLKQNLEQFITQYPLLLSTPPKRPIASPLLARPAPISTVSGLTPAQAKLLADDIEVHVKAEMPHLFTAGSFPSSVSASDQAKIAQISRDRMISLFPHLSTASSPSSPTFPSFSLTSPTSPTTPPLVTGSGISRRGITPIHMIPFGHILIDNRKFKKGILSIAKLNGNTGLKQKVHKFPNRKVSKDFKEALAFLITHHTIPDLSHFNEGEREYMYRLLALAQDPSLKLASTTQRTKVKEVEKAIKKDRYIHRRTSQLGKMKERFNILIGEVQSGNRNNPVLNKELKKILSTFVNSDLLSEQQAIELLNDNNIR